ncbi:MAG: DUF3848 domain-containing protein [Ruminococcus sp.]
MNPYYRERKRELNHQLYERVHSPNWRFFIKKCSEKRRKKFMKRRMRLSAKHEIAAAFARYRFSPVSVKALLKSPNLLNDIYEEWQ